MTDGTEEGKMTDKPVTVRKKMGLGRGLDALLGEAIRDPAPHVVSSGEQSDVVAPRGVSSILVANIHPNPDQPRRHFAEEALAELAQSIRKHGVIQPIVVRPFDGAYQIVAGERRWRAAQKAQMHEIPALIRDFDDRETLEIALIENIQRQDLNPIEEAEAYKKLSDEFGHSQAALAEIVEKSRSHVANMMRLLELPLPIRDLLIEGSLQMGHARALLSSVDAVRLAVLVVKQGLSVRDTEALVRKEKHGGKAPVKTSAGHNLSDNADIRAVESHLGDLLGLKVRINHKGKNGAGAVTFEYNSLDQLDMLCQRLTGEKF